MKSMALQQGRWMVHIPSNFDFIDFMDSFNYLKAAELLWADYFQPLSPLESLVLMPLDQPWKDEKLSQPCSHLIILNPELSPAMLSRS